MSTKGRTGIRERLAAAAPGGVLFGLLVGSTFTVALDNVAVGVAVGAGAALLFALAKGR
jgi:hypothetical protein